MSPVAIMTASDSGIGQESANELAENGFGVGITDHTDEAGVQETLEAVGAAGQKGKVRRLDLTELPDAADVIDNLADSLGGVDVLVNNAGTGDPTGDFLELSYEEWQQVIDTNLSGAVLCAQRAARRMAEAGNGGRIVNITSIHEHVPRTGASAYCSSKAGLGLLTKVMAMELAEHGILINAVGPGEISTPMTGAEDEDPTTIVRPNLPLGHPGRARDRRLGRLPRFREGLPRNGRLVRRRRRPYADGGGVVELEDEFTRAAFELVVFVAEVSGKALVEDPETVGEG